MFQPRLLSERGTANQNRVFVPISILTGIATKTVCVFITEKERLENGSVKMNYDQFMVNNITQLLKVNLKGQIKHKKTVGYEPFNTV